MKLVSFLFLPIVVVICLVGDVSCQRQDNRNYNQPAEARGSTGGRGPPIKSHGETPKWPASDGGKSSGSSFPRLINGRVCGLVLPADGGFTEPEPEPDFGEMLREFDSFTKVFNEEW